MFTTIQRAILMAVLASFGAIGFARGGFIEPAMAAVGSLWLVYGWSRYGTVALAFRALRRGHLERAAKLLTQIRFPERLGPQYLAYYFWVQGTLADEEGRAEEARRHFTLAYQGRLRTEHDRCVLACCLADLAIRCSQPDQAREYLTAARTHVHRSELDPVIEKLETALTAGAETPIRKD